MTALSQKGPVECVARAPWSNRGWLDKLIQCLAKYPEKHNMKLKQSVELRNMHRSCNLRCEVTRKDDTSIELYSKTALHYYYEAKLTRLIARLLPEFVSMIIESSRDSFIQHEAGKSNGHPEPFTLMNTLANMHAQWIRRVSKLVSKMFQS